MPPKVNQKKFPVSTIYLQVIGSGAPGAPRSLYVFSEHCRYLFNCGEGTQRLANEHKVKLAGLEHVFVTKNSWENVGGVPGMLLTLQDSGVSHINLYGPPGIETVYRGTKDFMRFWNLEINSHQFVKPVDFTNYDNGPLAVKTIILEKDKVNDNFQAETLCFDEPKEFLDLFGHEKDNCFRKRKSENPEELKKYYQKIANNKDLAIAYICQLPSKTGALLPKKCVELGVPKGPLFGQLKLGEDVVLENGTVVRSRDVTSPAEKGAIFIVIEIPTEDYLNSLIECKEFCKYQTDEPAQIVVHFTSSNVMTSSSYKQWLNQFPSSTKHIIVNENNICMGSERVHKIQYKLNYLYPESFPLLKEHYSNTNKKRKGDTTCAINYKFCDRDLIIHKPTMIQAFSMMTFHLRPNLGFEFKTDLRIDPELYLTECQNQPGFIESKKDSEALMSARTSDVEYPNIVFLGTGSCIPNKTRNTSGILINLSSNASIIMDCGEGTYGQLVRMFGMEQTDHILRKVKAVYVSHLHADHHIGLIRIIIARKKALQKSEWSKFLLLAPSGIRQYLAYFHLFEPITTEFEFVDNFHLGADDNEETRNLVCNRLDIQSISTCFVRHCPYAYGVALVLMDGWKFVYSGDTMPSDNLIRIGESCDVLIHEATMEDALHEDAKHKRHSTISDAINVGVKMKAKYEILTHFSQRYSKVPLIESLPKNVSIAFDNMVVHLKDLNNLPLLYDAMVKLFSEEYEEMMIKTEKKRKAKEMLHSIEEK